MKDNSAQTASKRYRRYYTYIEPVVVDPVIRGYFTLIASMLLTAFFILFALSPTFSTIVGLYRKISDQKKLITTMDTKISNLIVAQENYTDFEPYLPLLNTSFPSKPAPESVITGALKDASASGVSVNAFQISQAYLSGSKPPLLADDQQNTISDIDVAKTSRSELITSLKIPVVEFSITISGSEPNIRAFIGRMQNLPRIISLSQVTVGVNEDDQNPDPNSYLGTINAVAYYYPRDNQGQIPNQ